MQTWGTKEVTIIEITKKYWKLLTHLKEVKNNMNNTSLFKQGSKMIAFIEKFKCGGKKIVKAEDGTKVGSASYTIQKGDNLIKIARQFGLNSLDEILALNPQIKNPNLIREGQILNLPKDKMKQNGRIEATAVSAKMPNYDRVDYANLPASVKTKVDGYAQAIRDRKMKVSDVPALYRQQSYNQSIRSATNEAAPIVATKALMAP